MKIGNLVRYKKFPHKELHASGMVGLVVSEPRPIREWMHFEDALIIDIIWGSERGALYPAGTICQEFPCEIEVINE